MIIITNTLLSMSSIKKFFINVWKSMMCHHYHPSLEIMRRISSFLPAMPLTGQKYHLSSLVVQGSYVSVMSPIHFTEDNDTVRYDNYLVRHAIAMGVDVVDVSRTLLVVHQQKGQGRDASHR